MTNPKSRVQLALDLLSCDTPVDKAYGSPNGVVAATVLLGGLPSIAQGLAQLALHLVDQRAAIPPGNAPTALEEHDAEDCADCVILSTGCLRAHKAESDLDISQHALTEALAKLSASEARVRELEGKLANCSQWAQGRDHARIAAVDSLAQAERTIVALRSKLNSVTIPIDPRRDAVVEAARAYIAKADDNCYDDPPMDKLELLRSSLSALDASPEPAQGERKCSRCKHYATAHAENGCCALCRCDSFYDEHGSDPRDPEPAPVAEAVPAIVMVGSVWRHKILDELRTVEKYVYGRTVQWVAPYGHQDQWDSALFFAKHEFVSNPPTEPSEPSEGGVK